MNYHQPTLMHEVCINASENPYKSSTSTSSPYNKNNITHHSGHQSATEFKFIDAPCGTGKTSYLLKNFEEDKQYLVIVPVLTEVKRFIKDANVEFSQPSEKETGRKSSHLVELLQDKKNVVITHKLLSDIAYAGKSDLLNDYHVIIDEVLDVVTKETFCSEGSYKQVYLGGQFVTEDADGKVTPTDKWHEVYEDIADTLSVAHYRMACAGTLFHVGKGEFLKAMPLRLLQEARSVSIYTYMAEGSMMLAYVKKLGISYKVEEYPHDDAWRRMQSELITVKTISALEDVGLSYSQQTSGTGLKKLLNTGACALSNLRQRELKDVLINDILITCVKANWMQETGSKKSFTGFAKGSKMQKAHWC